MKIKSSSQFIFLVFLFFSSFSFSQNPKIDSLLNELKNHKAKDTIRVNILNQLAFSNYRNNPPKSIEYAEQAVKLADNLKFVKGKARSFYIKGATYTEQSNFNIATENFNKAIALYSSIDDLEGISKCKNAIGVLYYYKGDSQQALKNYEEALAMKEKLGIKNNDALLLNIGNIYSDLGDYQGALANFNKALKINKKTNDSQGILNCLNSIGNVYYMQGNYPLALNYYKESLYEAQNANDSIGIFQSYINTGNLYRMQNLNDKALIFYNKALDIKNAQNNVKNITALKNNIAGIYYDNKEYNTAIVYYKESIDLSKEIDDVSNLATALNGLGFIYFETKKYSTALTYFQEAYEITLENELIYDLLDSYHGMSDTYYSMENYDLALINAQKLAELATKYEFLSHRKNAFGLLYKIHKQTKNYKQALKDHELFKELSDSLFNEENIQKIAQLESEFKYKQEIELGKDRELKLTRSVKKTTKDLQKSKQNFLVGIIVFLIITILLGGVIFYLKLRNVKSQTQNIIIEQKLLRSQMTPHFIFNSLSVLQGMILNKENKKSVSYLSKFSKLLRIILENSRYKTVSIQQEINAVENYLSLLNLENETYQYSILVDNKLSESSIKIPPMLIQPFVENAIEHAFENQMEIKKIDINISYNNEDLICTITDNGIGIGAQQENQRKDKKSLSTTITTERLEMLSKDFKKKGSISIEDRKNYNQQGTIVTLVIPYIA